MRLVAVDTSSRLASVAAFDGDRLVGEETQDALGAAGEALLTLVDGLLRRIEWTAEDVARWAVDLGPGSFTGLRIGLATVKGILLATGAQLVGVCSLDALAAGACDGGGVALGVLPAGRQEVFVQAKVGDRTLVAPSHLRQTEAMQLAASLAEQGPVVVVGQAARDLPWPALPARLTLRHEPPYDWPRASAVGRLALRAPALVDVDAVEPLYVRPPDITLAKASATPGASSEDAAAPEGGGQRGGRAP